MSISRCLKLPILLAVLPGAALACGPDFPFEFLTHRDETLARLPDGLFMLEAGRLVSPPAHFFSLAALSGPTEAAAGRQERALYEAGAALWKGRARAKARPSFEALLSLPEGERRGLTLPAEYSLAELGAPAEARRRFATVRALAASGWADPRALAVTSLGEEARLALDEGDDPRALALYAEQAAHGSTSGATSLLFVARQLVTDETRLAKSLADPLTQRLVATYLWTRSEEYWWGEGANGRTPAQVLDLLASQPALSGADRLAAALFRAGRFEDSERLAEKERTPLAHWVKAKLLTRRGERAAAELELEAAAAGYPLSEAWSVDYRPDYRPRQQLELERSILALTHDDFEGAMRHAEASCSWEDVAYLAERVLELPALKALVDAPAPSPNPCAPLKSPDDVDNGEGWKVADQRLHLRALFARRLLREGHGAEALPYFDDTLRPDATAYVKALGEGGEGLPRARSLFTAAQLARREGLELLGYEGAPDYRWAGGYYDPGLVLTRDAGVSDEEWRRYQATAPRYPTRYSYRPLASQLAEQAANQVSHRSQTFTALLCKAASFVGTNDEARVRALWQRAVKEGPLLDEPMSFGFSCPEPRFEPPPPAKVKPWHPRKRWLAGGALAGGCLLGVLAVLLRRRRA